MRHVVVVQEISLERCDKFLGAPVFQAYSVVHARIVDQHIESPEIAQRLLHRQRTVVGRRKVSRNESSSISGTLQLRLQLLPGIHVAIDDDRDSILARTTADNRGPDALRAPGDKNDFAFKL